MTTFATLKGVKETAGQITVGYRQYTGTLDNGKTAALRVLDNDTYVYMVGDNFMETGDVVGEYSCVYDPEDGRVADSEALCIETIPPWIEGDRADVVPYKFVYSAMYGALGMSE